MVKPKLVSMPTPVRGARHIELVGTIKSPGQTRYSMSWSSDGRYLATSTGEDVSVWRLPGRDLHYANKIAARSTMSEDEETIQVGGNGVEASFSDCRLIAFLGNDGVCPRHLHPNQIIQYAKLSTNIMPTFSLSTYGHHFVSRKCSSIFYFLQINSNESNCYHFFCSRL